MYNIVSGKHSNQTTVESNLSHVSITRGNIYINNKMQPTYVHLRIRALILRRTLGYKSIIYVGAFLVTELLQCV
jgi:hypothetical protein